MVVDMETRLRLCIGSFLPEDGVHEFRYPATHGGVQPTVQKFVGGVTDRETRAPSTAHLQRGVVLLEAPTSAELAQLRHATANPELREKPGGVNGGFGAFS